jgi:hypothetical protein
VRVPVFLSCPTPFLEQQRLFIAGVTKYLEERGLEPRTLGQTNYDLDTPLRAVRRMLRESNGVLTIALRRHYITTGSSKPSSDMGAKAQDLSGQWFTSAWSQIEPAMAFQLGLPVMVLRESGVLADGILERGILDVYLPEFDVTTPVAEYVRSAQWTDLVSIWERHVRSVAMKKGTPPKLY